MPFFSFLLLLVTVIMVYLLLLQLLLFAQKKKREEKTCDCQDTHFCNSCVIVGFSSVKPFGGSYGFESKLGSSNPGSDMGPAWQGRSIAGPKLRMVEFSAFLEQQRDPDSVCANFVLPINLLATLYICALTYLETH